MVTLSRATDGAPLWRLTVAGSWLGRLRGLMGHKALRPGEGLYLPGTNGVHMLFMRFAIDCVFVGERGADGARAIVALRENLAPWTGVIWWVRGARGAIEVPAGDIARARLRLGDRVVLDSATAGRR